MRNGVHEVKIIGKRTVWIKNNSTGEMLTLQLKTTAERDKLVDIIINRD